MGFECMVNWNLGLFSVVVYTLFRRVKHLVQWNNLNVLCMSIEFDYSES